MTTVENTPEANEIATIVADRCHGNRKPGQAPERYAVIWQAARLGAIEAMKQSAGLNPAAVASLTEAEWQRISAPLGLTSTIDQIANALRERGLIAPEPVDPLLVEAREIVKATLTPERHKNCNCREEIDAGDWDDRHSVRAALAALRRGMELRPELTRGQVVHACMAVGISRFMHSLDFDRLHAALTDGGRDE